MIEAITSVAAKAPASAGQIDIGPVSNTDAQSTGFERVSPQATTATAGAPIYASADPTAASAASSSMQAAVSERTLGSRLFKAIAAADADYYRLFPNGFNVESYGSISNATEHASNPPQPSNSYDSGPADALLTSEPTSGTPGGAVDFSATFIKLQEAHHHSIQVSFWAARMQLLTALVTKGSDGLQTLFRNSGS